MVNLVIRTLRYASLLVLIAPLTPLGEQHPTPSVPSGYDLYTLPITEFQAYVSGVYDGQAALVNAIGIQPVVCLDAHMTRRDLASRVLYALPKLPEKAMALPANDVVFRVLVEHTRCPGVRWNHRN